MSDATTPVPDPPRPPTEPNRPTERTDPAARPAWRLPRWALPNELAVLDGWPAGKRTARDWCADAALFLVAVGVYALALNDSLDPDPTYVEVVPDWMMAADPWVGALACLSLWLRRRFPLALALAMGPAFLVSSTAYGAVLIVILTVAIHRGWVPATVMTAFVVTFSVLFAMAWQPPDLSFRGYLATIAVISLLPLSWGLVVRFRRQLLVSLRRDAERQRDEHERRLTEARRAERQRIAWEMHDVLAHRISLLSVHAGALDYRTGSAGGAPPTPEEIASAARVIRENAHQALEELGQVLSVLRDEPPDERATPPTLGDLPTLVDEARSAGQHVELEMDVAHPQPREHEQRTAYRVVQEGLTNARKHAPGAPVTVRLAGSSADGLVVEVSNPLPIRSGRAPTTPGAEAGLSGLRERVELDGGSLEHGPVDGVFRLTAHLRGR